MSDAEKLFRLDCQAQNILAMAKLLLMSCGRLEISHEDFAPVSWTILNNKWSFRESIYRFNVYDDTGHFQFHAYSTMEVMKKMEDHFYSLLNEQLDQWFEARGDRNG